MEQDIYLNTIHLDRATLRHSVTEESVKQLANSIRDHGLLQAIVVTPRQGGGYRLIAGRRRLTACQLLGYTTIPARILDTDEMDELPALAENLMRLNMNPLEEANAVTLLYEQKNLSIHEIAERTNHGVSWVQDRLAIRAMPDPFKQAIADRSISIAGAMQLLQITDEEYRNYLLRVAEINGATVNQCQAWWLEWQARQMLTNPTGQQGPLPHPPSRLPLYTPPCTFCDTPIPEGPQILLRVCPTCNAELHAAKTRPPAQPDPDGANAATNHNT